MKVIIGLILSCIVYFGLGWIVYDIYTSIYPIEGSTLISDIYLNEILCYNGVACAFNFALIIFSKQNFWEDYEFTAIIIGFSPLVLYYVLKIILPMSIGAALINTILCIISMVVAFYLSFKD